MDEKIWCDVIDPGVIIEDLITERIRQARKDGHSRLEIQAAAHIWLNKILFECQIEEVLGDANDETKSN